MKTEKFIKAASFLAAIAVTLGALGTHTLKDILTSEQIASFQTGVRYQLFHSISILTLALNAEKFNSKIYTCLKTMIIGLLCFSFSIYLLNIQYIIGVSLSFLGPITPIGGALLIYSWIILIFSIKK